MRAVTTDPAPDLRLSGTSTVDALAAGQPFVLVVDSTRFRVSPACGRAIVMARYLLDRWRDVAFIHLEPYRYSVVADTAVLDGSLDAPTLTDPAAAWGIGGAPWGARSMPWVFVVDGHGIVRAKYQGVIGQRRRRRHPGADRPGRLTPATRPARSCRRAPFGPCRIGPDVTSARDGYGRHHRSMDTLPQDDLPTPDPVDAALSRRGFLRAAALTGGGIAAVGGSRGLCAGDDRCRLDLRARAERRARAQFGGCGRQRRRDSGAQRGRQPRHARRAPSPAASAAASAQPPGTIPAGWTAHDVEARDKVRRYVGDLAPAFKDIYPAPVFLKLAAILGVEDDYPGPPPEARLRPGPAARTSATR